MLDADGDMGVVSPGRDCDSAGEGGRGDDEVGSLRRVEEVGRSGEQKRALTGETPKN